MSSGSARRGRRDNGLDAAVYAAAGDVDPRVGEHLLDVLALQGIAAYLQPAVDLNPVTRSAVMPPRPTDRLFVDRAHLDTARDYLSQLAEPRPTEIRAPQSPPAGVPPAEPPPAVARPGTDQPGDAPGQPGQVAGAGGDAAVDDVWAQIVAGYDAEVDTSAVAWPEAENLTTDRRAGQDPDSGGAAARPAAEGLRSARDTDHPPSLLDGLDTFGAGLPDDEDDDEGYTPPPPPPLPRISSYAILGILAIVAGFVLFLRPGLLPVDNDLSMLVGFGGILAGFITLVWRLRPGDEEDDDPDDGARV